MAFWSELEEAFRGFNAAASLKLILAHPIGRDGKAFRGFNAAASLKHSHRPGNVAAAVAFRGFYAAASLKQTPPGNRPIPGREPSAVLMPRPH